MYQWKSPWPPHPHSDGLYPQGTEVTVSLSATPPNVAFIRWEDYAQGDGVQMTVTVDRKLRIRALFTLRPNETPVPAPPRKRHRRHLS